MSSISSWGVLPENEIVRTDDTIVLDCNQLRDVTLDDERLMRELIATLIDDTTRQLGELDRALREGNAQEVVRLAHYSKGACANLGASSTAAALRELERTARRGDVDACGRSLARALEELEKVRQAAARLTPAAPEEL